MLRSKVATRTSTKVKVAIGVLFGAGIIALAAGFSPALKRRPAPTPKPDLQLQSSGYRSTGEFFTLRNEGTAGISATAFASAGQVRFDWLDASMNQLPGVSGGMISTTTDLPAGRVVGGPTGWKLTTTTGEDAAVALSRPPAGAASLRLTADVLNAVAESNESNNVLVIKLPKKR